MGEQVKYHASKTNFMRPKQNSSDQPKYHVIKPNQWPFKVFSRIAKPNTMRPTTHHVTKPFITRSIKNQGTKPTFFKIRKFFAVC